MSKHDALLTWRIGTLNPRPASARALADSLACEGLPYIPDHLRAAVTAFRHLRRDARERAANAVLERVSLQTKTKTTSVRGDIEEEVAAQIEMLVENAPDVESGDESAEDVSAYWRGLFDRYVEFKVREAERSIFAGLQKLIEDLKKGRL